MKYKSRENYCCHNWGERTQRCGHAEIKRERPERAKSWTFIEVFLWDSEKHSSRSLESDASGEEKNQEINQARIAAALTRTQGGPCRWREETLNWWTWRCCIGLWGIHRRCGEHSRASHTLRAPRHLSYTSTGKAAHGFYTPHTSLFVSRMHGNGRTFGGIGRPLHTGKSLLFHRHS